MASKRMAAKILREAANSIEAYGWCQGRLGNLQYGYCALGGIYRAETVLNLTSNELDNTRLARYALAKIVTGNQYASIPSWNDNKHRTKNEVIRAMRKTARALEHGMQAC